MKSNIFYRNNENLKAENVDIDYEHWQIEEIQKCLQDPVYFIKNYVKIVTPKGLELFSLRGYQEKIVNLIDKEKRVIYLSGRQSGKCFLGNTKIKVRNKHTMEVCEITIENFLENIREK